ncbi:MAG: hypothetical protein FK734_15730 [Asgard group archaeon]|nr:hypothetical protein [Asgard group archaeon]
MFKAIEKCALCGEVNDRDKMILYHFPQGPKLVCKKCYQSLPTDPYTLGKKPIEPIKPPNSDILPLKD